MGRQTDSDACCDLPEEDYLTLRRMSYAQALLLDSSFTILDVAMEGGLGTVGAFGQAFKKLLGQSHRNIADKPSPDWESTYRVLKLHGDRSRIEA